jgi:hypothetical protein
LADALHGGDTHGPNIDQLVESLPTKGGAGHSLETLANHDHGHVPNGHSAVFAGFTNAHGGPILDHIMVHQDAAPAHG